MPYKDIEKRRAVQREYYYKNKERCRRSVKERTEANIEWFYTEIAPGLKCERCPEDNIACLEFHHVVPKKKGDYNVSSLIHTACSRKRILEEIAKCECLCANCHRKGHFRHRIAKKEAAMLRQWGPVDAEIDEGPD